MRDARFVQFEAQIEGHSAIVAIKVIGQKH
jgi:hypothetical protein